jgi:hypothetical protein
MEELIDLSGLKLNNDSTLLNLPTEIHLAIISHLEFPETQFLRHSCHAFSTLIPAISSLDDLLTAEKWEGAQTLNLFTCAVCMRLRISGKFADAHRKGPFGREGRNREKRFCIDWGMKPPAGANSKLRYQWGDMWTRFGMPYVKCKGCRSKKRGVMGRKDCEMCPDCWRCIPAGWYFSTRIEGDPGKSSPPPYL